MARPDTYAQTAPQDIANRPDAKCGLEIILQKEQTILSCRSRKRDMPWRPFVCSATVPAINTGTPSWRWERVHRRQPDTVYSYSHNPIFRHMLAALSSAFVKRHHPSLRALHGETVRAKNRESSNYKFQSIKDLWSVWITHCGRKK